MFGLGMQELVIIGIVAVLLFGRRLPEVARSMGSSYREFKKGLHDIQSQVDFNSHSYQAPPTSSSYDRYDEYDDAEEATAPKFEPPPAEPQASSEPSEHIAKPIDEK